jgi:hypothetical protein
VARGHSLEAAPRLENLSLPLIGRQLMRFRTLL